MCDCKQETERRLVDALAEPDQLPKGAEKIEARLTGYAMMFGNGTMRYKQIMPIEIEYSAPTKAGVLKRKKQKMSMVANYCMFCGEKYETNGDS